MQNLMRIIPLLVLAVLGTTLTAATAAEESGLVGRWVLSPELTHEEQPDGPKQRGGLFGGRARTSVFVGGVPLPSGGDGLPPVSGNPSDPDVLRASELVIEPIGEELRLDYQGVGSETLKRGNDRGLVSRWNDRRLTTRYETTSRKVSQEYEVRRDGTLLVTVKLDPDQGATTIYKRVFERMPIRREAGAQDR